MPIEFDGLDDVVQRLIQISEESKVQAALGKAALKVEDAARAKAPKGRTGDLGKFIESKVDGLTGVIFSPMKYAPYVEYGTGKFAENGNGRKDVPWRYEDELGEWHTTFGQHPHPFMRPALDENRDEINRIMLEELIK